MFVCVQELVIRGHLTALDELCDRASVFARVNPDHKEVSTRADGTF
jgi:hypothetical protein